ncbi:MAG TPA: hypothetical protein VK034_12335 [Enhygromyxa sp.]|nr:hypothetical protein [Enhygromyxa sp.]
MADGGRRIYAASFAAPTGRGLRRRPEPRDHAVFALDQFGAMNWRDVCSHFEGIHTIAASRDGNTVAAGGWYSSEPWAGFVTAWTGSGMRLLTWNEAPSRIDEVALSADGTVLFAVGEALYSFRRKPGQPFPPRPTATIELAQGFNPTLAIDEGGKWIATTDTEGSVHLFERIDGAIAARRYLWETPVVGTATRIALSADGDWLLVGTGDGVLHMFNRRTFIATNRAVWTYPVLETTAPTILAITPDGGEIVALYERGDGGAVYLLGNRDGAPHLHWVKQTKHTPTVAALSPQLVNGDGVDRWIAVADADPRGSSGNFYVFERATGLIAGAHSCAAGCHALALDQRGSRLIGGSDDGCVYAFGLP